MFEFLELIVRIALQRQNPKLGTVGHEHSVEEPLPGCLDYLLTEHILKFAQRDALKEVAEAMMQEAALLDTGIKAVVTVMIAALLFGAQQVFSSGL